MNAAASAMERAGECAAIAITGVRQGYGSALSDALALVYGDQIHAAGQQAGGGIDPSQCPRPLCPALFQAIDATVSGFTRVTGELTTELLTALVLAVRRLSELQGITPAEAVADLVSRTNGGC